MRVWVLGRGVPTKRNNLLGSFEFEQAQMLKRAGHEVYYFGMNIRSARDWDRFGYRYESVEGLETASFSFPLNKIMSASRAHRSLKKAFLKTADKMSARFGAPDIIHIHYPAMWPYSAFETFQKNGVGIVATEHWTQVQEKSISDAYVSNIKDFAAKSDALLCVGSYLVTAIRELTGTDREILVVPNVANKLFRPVDNKHDGFRFFTAGRFVPVKQFDKTVAAFCKVFKDIPDVTLTVAGSGEEAENIKNQVSADMADRVVFTGTVSREKMAELTADSDVMITYSRLETFCVPVIEAWSCGIPAIAASSSPVMVDYPDERLGIEVDCDKTETLEEALKCIYEGYDKYDSKWISRFAAEHFSEKAVSKQLTDIYQQVMRINK